MPEFQYFSDEAGLHRPETGLVFEDFPIRARNSLRAIVKTLTNPYGSTYVPASDLALLVVSELGADPDITYDDHGVARIRIDGWLEVAEWWELLDFISLFFRFAQSLLGSDEERFRSSIQRALRRFHSAYILDEHGLVRVEGANQTEIAVAEARMLLTGSEFSGSERQFNTALEALSRRPEPNHEVVVSESANALEGVARTVLDNDSITLGRAVNRIKMEKNLHPALAESIKKIYGYASDSGGRHGLTGEPDVDAGIAEFCLHQSAAAMVFFAKLYGYEQHVVRGQ